jgi:hypothetical protein
MATLIKKNEKVVAPFFKNGPRLQFITLTFPGDVTALLTATVAGVKSPVAQALEAISQVASIELIGTPVTSVLPLAVAAIGGDYATEMYDSMNSQTFAAYCQTLIQAAGTSTGALQGVANASTTVAAGVRGSAF